MRSAASVGVVALVCLAAVAAANLECASCDLDGRWTLRQTPFLYQNQADFPDWVEWMPDSTSLSTFWSFWYTQSASNTVQDCVAAQPSYIHLFKYQREIKKGDLAEHYFLDKTYPVTAATWSDWCNNSWVFSPNFVGVFRFPDSPVPQDEWQDFANSLYSVDAYYRTTSEGCSVQLKPYDGGFNCRFGAGQSAPYGDPNGVAWYPSPYFCGQVYPAYIDLRFNCDDESADYCATQWNNDISDPYAQSRSAEARDAGVPRDFQVRAGDLPRIGHMRTLQTLMRQEGQDTLRARYAEHQTLAAESMAGLDAREVAFLQGHWPQLPLVTYDTLNPLAYCFNRVKKINWRDMYP